MANTYYTLLTQAGQASIANAIALGQQVTLTHMAVGDGNGAPTVPKETQTELVNEVYRAAINQLLTDPDNPNYLIAEMIVPTNVGGWSVREVGLFDESGDLLAIANFPETYKPKLEEGSGRDLIIRIILQVQSTDAITLKIDPTIVLASQAWVKENFTRAILLPGGTTGQFLAKKSDANGDTEWKDISVMTGATAETAGKQGFVPAPQAGDEEKVLTGSGEWKHASGVPIGFIGYYGATTPPAGFLKCDGAAVGRATYPELFAAIGTTYGEGDGETTFNLPDLIRRFAEGSATPGTVKEAGLPNIAGGVSLPGLSYGDGGNYDGALYYQNKGAKNGAQQSADIGRVDIGIDASRSNPTYGKSDTVQPPALTLLPCIKAFDAAVDSGLIDITELANEVAGKADTNLSNLSTTGKTKVANLAMPSGIYIDLTLPTSGQHITAPADGYVYLEKYAANPAEYIVMQANYIGVAEAASSVDQILRVTLPVKKGSIVTPTYTASGTTTAFRFTYAEGSQP